MEINELLTEWRKQSAVRDERLYELSEQKQAIADSEATIAALEALNLASN